MPNISPKKNSFDLGIFLSAELDESNLDPYEFRVWAHLCRRANDQKRTWGSQSNIASVCKISERKVRDVLIALESRGMIQRRLRRRQDGSRTTDDIFLLPFKPEAEVEKRHEVQNLTARDAASQAARDAVRGTGIKRHDVPRKEGIPALKEEGIPANTLEAKTASSPPIEKPSKASSEFQLIFTVIAYACYGSVENLTNTARSRTGKAVKSLIAANYNLTDVEKVIKRCLELNWKPEMITPQSIEGFAPKWRSECETQDDEAYYPILTGDFPEEPSGEAWG